MDNPTRTAAHRDRISKRRSDLQSTVTSVLPDSSDFVCEIGCGHGHFLAAFGAVHPDRLCVGIDISRERIDRAVRKRDRAKLSNLHFLHAEARDFLDALPPKVTISALYILFPDPWPKRRHHKNRLMQPEFLRQAAERAGKGARLYFRTDDQAYFRATEAVLERDSHWKVVAEPWPFEHVTVFQSRAAQHYSLIAQRRAG